MFELRLDGHATGFACAAAARLERWLPMAAFKMAHPLEVRASVLLDADEAGARAACVRACHELCADLDALLDQLPADDHAKRRLWPERQHRAEWGVTLRPRQMDDEA